MPLTPNAKNVIERPLPPEKIKKRPGKAGMTYDYVTPDFIINLLNEAFDYRWSTSVFHQEMYGDTAVVGLNLTVWDAENNAINKSQFGSCNVGHGMGPGEAFKGAASDAMKKSATLLGVAIELYEDDEPSKTQFQKPAVPPKPPTPLSPPKAPDARPAVAPPSNAAVMPPRPPAPSVPRAMAPPALPRPAAPAVSSPVAAPRKVNPFSNGNGGHSAAISKPVAPPAAPKMSVAPKSNPFESRSGAAGPNPTQLNALVNLAQRKVLSQADMIALAGVMDEIGNPKQAFEELSHSEAIQVIKASQL